MMSRLHVSDLIQIVPAAARLEIVGGENAARIRAGIIDLLVDSCDVTTLSSARFRLLQRVGEQQELRDAEMRLMDDALRRVNQRGSMHPSVFAADDSSRAAPPAIGA
jgi:hypothetical protein